MAHLTIDERFKIYEMNKTGYSSRYIGKKISRDVKNQIVLDVYSNGNIIKRFTR